MKKFLIAVIILAFIVAGIIYRNDIESKKGYQTVYNKKTEKGLFSVDIKLQGWQKVSFKGVDIHYDAVFIPEDMTLDTTDKKVLITFYSATQNYYPESYYNEYIDALRKQAKNKNGELITSLIKASTNEVIFEWKISTQKFVEMCRLYRTTKGLYIVKYLKLADSFEEKEREEVIKTIRSLKEFEVN